MLRPFRTFLEVEQPDGASFCCAWIPDEGIGFFRPTAASGSSRPGKNIADYFLKNMGDLIDAGKVVVMQ